MSSDGRVEGGVLFHGAGDICKEKLISVGRGCSIVQHGFCWQNEKNGTGIQESYVAMETTAKRAGDRERERERYTVYRDGQVFLLGYIDGVFNERSCGAF